MKFAIKTIAACAMLAGATASFAQKGETVKIAWLDPLSGLMASVGTNQLKTTQYLAEEFNKKNLSGVKFEVIGIDNKLSPQETTSALRSAQDQGARYIMQGNGSGPALAIMDAIEKNNARNPGKELLFMNYAAVDPDLTNSKCSYWHFRLDADTSMKMEALTTWIKDQPDIKKVYILGQNYAHGVQVSKYAKEDLKVKRPDIQIVGDDLHPLAQVRDFSPY
ncbi:MAG: branched-chain amino acid ABC transporter substrate-binding protein, partial [Alcaligenaceae bacterium]